MKIAWKSAGVMSPCNDNKTAYRDGVLRGRWDIIPLNSWRRHEAPHLLGEFARGIQEQSRLMPQQHPRRGTRG